MWQNHNPLSADLSSLRGYAVIFATQQRHALPLSILPSQHMSEPYLQFPELYFQAVPLSTTTIALSKIDHETCIYGRPIT